MPVKIAPMSHYLPLSRVARLVGQPRSEIQRMVHHGELSTFDGMVDMNELLRVFPTVSWEDDGEFRRVQEIKDKAFGKRVYERALPDKEVLAERLYELGKEFAAVKTLLLHYHELLCFVGDKLTDVAESGGAETVNAVAACKQWLKRELVAVPGEAARAEALIAQESVMRIMSAQVTVLPSGHDFYIEGNDTILEAALRAGIPLNYGCSNGNCGKCQARLVSGQVKKVHPHDFTIREADKINGAFLLCSNTAITDVVIEAKVSGADDIPEQEITTKVKAVEVLNDSLAVLHLMAPRSNRLRFLAGQHVTLSVDNTEGEYYVASCPCEDRHIEVHVRRDNRGFSRKVFGSLHKEQPVVLSGPHGKFVMKLDSRRPILFIAWEEGFAPIKSLVQHAMSLEIAEATYLYWAASSGGHYQDNLCRTWTDALDNFVYQPLDIGSGPVALAEFILAHHPDLSHTDIYAAGPVEFLDALHSRATAHGLMAQGWHGEVV